MPTPSAPELDWNDPTLQAVVRFGRDLGELIDIHRDTVLVAVSGGPDSLGLLLLVNAILRDRCVAATVDHGLRSVSAREAEHVAAICRHRDIAHVTLSGRLPDRVGRTNNLSARARALRYSLLEGERARRGMTWIATGHHADDQLETFVMRANRGAGVAGLAGIRRRGMAIVRPVLGWRRAELAAVVAREGLVAIDDPSNTDARFDRARLRRELADCTWLDARRIGTAAAALAAADDALVWAAGQAYGERVVARGKVRILRPEGVPAEIIRRLVVRCLVEVDPACKADGPAVGRLAMRLMQRRPATLGGVLVTAADDRACGPLWRFRPAPPRRTG